MTCKVGKGIVLCGDFGPDDGQWHDGGYGASMHKCENCSYAARFVLYAPLNRMGSTLKGHKDRYRCATCKEAADGR